jgi:hypothetical protein
MDVRCGFGDVKATAESSASPAIYADGRMIIRRNPPIWGPAGVLEGNIWSGRRLFRDPE